MAFHEEQDFMNIIKLIEKDFLGVNSSGLQTLKYSQHKVLEDAILPSKKVDSNSVDLEKVAMILEERKEISEIF